MKHFIILLCFFSSSTSLFADSLNIYDYGNIERKSYFNPAIGEDFVRKNIKYLGEPKSSSKANGRAEAKLIKSDKAIMNNIVSWINNHKNKKYKNQGMETNISEIIDLKSITNPSMARVKSNNGGYDVIVFTGTFNGSIKTNDTQALRRSKNKPENIVWIGRYGNSIIETIYCDLSIDSIYDHTRTIKIDGIADIDGDGNYEIIINDIRYAGRLYFVIHTSASNHLIKEIHGDSWD